MHCKAKVLTFIIELVCFFLQAMHPNWRALATCIIRQQQFVTPNSKNSTNSEEVSIVKELSNNQPDLGREVSEIYNEIVNSPSTSKLVDSQYKPKIKIVNKDYKVQLNYSFNQFCEATTSANIKGLETILNSNPEYLHQCDQFGWSPLMMAACDGVIDSFKYLLKFGANPFKSNKTGQSAYLLAKQKSHYKILNVIFNFANETVLVAQSKEISPFYCELCEENFKESTKDQHQTSTLHQFNLQHHDFPTRFGISESNRGFQLMIKQGWDRNSGLGRARKGQLFPVKTQIRDFRTGLGVNQERDSRITHFKSNDVSAIKRRLTPKPYRRRDRERDLARDKRTERIIRNELS